VESVLSGVNCLRGCAESEKMGQLRPHSNTSELIACSAEPKTLRFVVLFEVPLCQSLKCLHVFHRDDPARPCCYCASSLQGLELAAYGFNAQTEIVANFAA